jgi:hypothetical protein
MHAPIKKHRIKNVGFISTPIAGTGGVSRVFDKWVGVFEAPDFNGFYDKSASFSGIRTS